MGLFGGSSRSSNSTTAATSNIANYNTGSAPAQNINLSGINSTGAGDLNLTVSTSDFGAIEAGKQIAQESLLRNSEAFSSAASLVARSQTAAQDTMTQAAALIKEKAETESEKLLKVAGVIAALFIVGGTIVFVYGGKGR